MRNFPRGGVLGRIRSTVEAVGQCNIPVHAANAGYFLILSLFPALVLVLAMIRYTGLEADALVGILEGIVPDALLPYAEDIIFNTYFNTTGTLVGVSAVTALWSASRGIYGLLTGLNAVYDVAEDRGYVMTRLISVGYTFAFLLVLLLTLVLHVFGTTIAELVSFTTTPFLLFLADAIDLRFFLLLFVQTALFCAMFMVFPNRRNRLSDSLPGAVLASCGWLVFSDLYSIYVEHFARLSNIYGSVYAIALSMLWLYFCISIVFYGGALNRWLVERRGG